MKRSSSGTLKSSRLAQEVKDAYMEMSRMLAFRKRRTCADSLLAISRRRADPVDLGAQSDLIGAPEPMSIEAAPAAPNGGSRAASRIRAATGCRCS